MFESLVNWATPLYVLAIFGLVVFFAGPIGDKKVPVKQRWFRVGEMLGVTLFIYFASQFAGGLVSMIYPVANGWDQNQISNWFDGSIIGQFVFVFSTNMIMVALLHSYLKRQKSGFKNIGLYGKPRLIDAGYALVGFGVYFIGYLIVLGATKSLIPGLDVDQQQQVGFDNASGAMLPLVFISLVVLPPLVEEIMIRGFLFAGLKRSINKYWAAILASALFAIAHLQAGTGAKLLWVAAIDTFVLSLVLIYLREKSGGRLWAPILLHGLKNCIAFLVLFVFKLV